MAALNTQTTMLYSADETWLLGVRKLWALSHKNHSN